MPSFGTLKTRVANKINISNDDSLIGEAINEAIAFFQREHLWFNEASASFSTVADNPDLAPSPNALPANFIYEREQGGVILTQNDTKYPLEKITHLERESINSNSTSTPRYYTFREQKIYLYPIPDQVYTVDLYYIKSYDELTTDNESNDWTNYADRLIVAKALADLYLDERHSDTKLKIYEAKVKNELQALKNRTNKNLTTGRLRTDSLLYDINDCSVDYGYRDYWSY